MTPMRQMTGRIESRFAVPMFSARPLRCSAAIFSIASSSMYFVISPWSGSVVAMASVRRPLIFPRFL
jgi:hypothetical protein